MNKIYSLNLSMDMLADLIRAARESENVEYIEPEMAPGAPVYGTFAGTFRGQAQYVHVTTGAPGTEGLLVYFEGDPKLADILDVHGPMRSLQQLVEYFAAVEGDASFAKVLGVIVDDESFETCNEVIDIRLREQVTFTTPSESVVDKAVHDKEDDTVARTAAVKVLSVNLANMTLLGRYIVAEYLREITELKPLHADDLSNCKLWARLYDCADEELRKLNQMLDDDRSGLYSEEYVREHHPSAAAARDADTVVGSKSSTESVDNTSYFIAGLVVGAVTAVGLLKIFGRK